MCEECDMDFSSMTGGHDLIGKPLLSYLNNVKISASLYSGAVNTTTSHRGELRV
jgi:hypothetical protein